MHSLQVKGKVKESAANITSIGKLADTDSSVVWICDS